MSTKEKRRPISGPAALTVCLLAVLAAGGFLFNGYLQQQIYVERSAQLREVTAQVRVNLDNALEAHWRTLMSAVRLLEERDILLYRTDLNGTIVFGSNGETLQVTCERNQRVW